MAGHRHPLRKMHRIISGRCPHSLHRPMGEYLVTTLSNLDGDVIEPQDAAREVVEHAGQFE